MTRRQWLSMTAAAIGGSQLRLIAAPPLSTAEREYALGYLRSGRDDLLRQVTGLTPAQWSFKPAPEVWSIAEILEHVVVVEEAQIESITSATKRLPARAAADRPRVRDQVIEMVTTNRETRRFQSPEVFRPTGRWPQASGLVEAFGAARSALITYTSTTSDDLRSVAWDNPLVGLTDGFQWILFVTAHGVRHTKQLTELKADPQFPRGSR